MKEQLRLLEELQRHDARIQELDGSHRAIPSKLEGMKKDLNRLEEMLETEKAQLAEAVRLRDEKKTQLESDEQLHTKARTRLAQVKNSKEYMASQREVEALRKIVADGEETLVSLNAGAEQMGARISAHGEDVEKLRKLVETEEASAREKLDTIGAGLAEARAARDKAAAAVRPDVLKKYDSIRMRRGLAVVPAVSGTCRGCNMKIPPQLYNILQRGNSIEVCPTCHRIIYWSKLLEDPDGAPSDADAPAK